MLASTENSIPTKNMRLINIIVNMGYLLASFPGLPLLFTTPSFWEEERKIKHKGEVIGLHYYRGVAKREVGEEGLGTRLGIFRDVGIYIQLQT